MKRTVRMQHVALQYKNKSESDIFFREILGLELIKEFKLSKLLAKQIFNVSEEINVFLYANKDLAFEIFITDYKTEYFFNHVCIKVPDKEEFVKKCKNNDLKPFFVEKGDKKLLFVKDFSDNLYEIK